MRSQEEDETKIEAEVGDIKELQENRKEEIKKYKYKEKKIYIFF